MFERAAFTLRFRGAHQKKRGTKPLFRDRVSKKPFSLFFQLDNSVLRAPRRLLLSPPNENKAFRLKPFTTRHKITSFSLLQDPKTLFEERLAVMRFFKCTKMPSMVHWILPVSLLFLSGKSPSQMVKSCQRSCVQQS